MSSSHKPESGGRIHLDAPTLECKFAHYPKELQEPCLWLGSYLRNECASDLDELTNRAQKIGVSLDKTTWGRILRGRLNRNAADEITSKLLVNQEKLLAAIASIRNNARLQERAGKVPFILTEHALAIWDFVDLRRAPDRVNKFGIVVGHTGTQKTAALKEYCRNNNHGLCVHLDAPAKASLNELISDLAERYDGTRQESVRKQQNVIWKAVNDRKTIVVENAQRLYDARYGANQPVFNFLQKLQDDTGCTIIITITPVFETTLTAGLAAGYFEQFIGRAGGVKKFLRLPKYAPAEDILKICAAFGLQEPDKHLDYLIKISREAGLIRILFDALQDAKVDAEAAGEPLTINHVRIARGED